MVYGVMDFRPIGGDEGKEEHRTDKDSENAHHNQGEFDAFLLSNFARELGAEPNEARTRKLRPVFRGHLFKDVVEFRIISHKVLPIPLSRINRGPWCARGRASP